MKLKTLFKDLPIEAIRGNKELSISGICANSKLVSPGSLFIAKQGLTSHGSQFIPEALAAGANAVLSDVYDPTIASATQVIAKDIPHLEAKLAARYYHNPSHELFLVGITGTNGKTTTAYLLRHLLDSLHGPCGLMGTIEYLIKDVKYQATHTTPDVLTNQRLLREMAAKGCKSASMEVTSHALAQGRVAKILFDAAIFTNLTSDHLDYHKTLEEYCRAKSSLFQQIKTGGAAVVNADSAWSEQIVQSYSGPVITYGIQNSADLKACSISSHEGKTYFTLCHKGRRYSCTLPLMGRFNVLNALAAIAATLALCSDLESICRKLSTFPPVPGRLERVENDANIPIYVDFAHTPDALESALKALSSLAKKRLIVVFGCGGGRDISKRSEMGRIAMNLGSEIFITSDNPRHEEPMNIIEDILKGTSSTAKIHVEPDRKKAITSAIEMATDQDLVAIFGKGHETYQIFAHQTIPFDDRLIAKEAAHRKREMSLP